MGTICVRHDGYHVAFKVLVRHVVGHSRPASVALSFVFFLHRYCDCYNCFETRKPFKLLRVCGIALVSGDTFPVYVPYRDFFCFSYPPVSQVIGY